MVQAATKREVKNEYYSGQGRLLIGKREANGKGYDFRHVGNATGVSVEIAIEKFEHNESTSGQRAKDLSIVKSQTASVKFTGESLSLQNLALGLYGDVYEVAGDDVVGEEHKIGDNGIIALNLPNVSDVSVKVGTTLVGAVAVTADKYTVDKEYGTIYIKDAAAFATANAKVFVDYTYGKSSRLDIFTNSSADEVYVRFEGVNTVNGDTVLLTIPRVTFDPLTALQLITEELGNAEFTGNVLLDSTIDPTTGSQFMTQYVVKAADVAA